MVKFFKLLWLKFKKGNMIYIWFLCFFHNFTRHLNLEKKIQTGIRYPDFRLAGYPACQISGQNSTVSGKSIVKSDPDSIAPVIAS
jgi:hypothetical protein